MIFWGIEDLFPAVRSRERLLPCGNGRERHGTTDLTRDIRRAFVTCGEASTYSGVLTGWQTRAKAAIPSNITWRLVSHFQEILAAMRSV